MVNWQKDNMWNQISYLAIMLAGVVIVVLSLYQESWQLAPVFCTHVAWISESPAQPVFGTRDEKFIANKCITCFSKWIVLEWQLVTTEENKVKTEWKRAARAWESILQANYVRQVRMTSQGVEASYNVMTLSGKLTLKLSITQGQWWKLQWFRVVCPQLQICGKMCNFWNSEKE